MALIKDGKVYRNLQEQVLENCDDIEKLFKMYGVKGPYEDEESVPSDVKIDGALILIGSSAPYTMYKYDSATDDFISLGQFPVAGPQGEEGPQGPQGEPGTDGAKGDTGAAAGFGTPTASATTLTPVQSAIASVTASGPDTAKVFTFSFGIPQGVKGDTGDKGDTGATGEDGADAGFGTPTATATSLAAGSNPTVSVSASGPDTAKVFAFEFGIPEGQPGTSMTAGTGIDITGTTISIKPDNLFTKSGINTITAGSIHTKTHNYDTYDGTENLAGLTIMDATTYTQTMLKPNHRTMMFFSAEQFMHASINRGEEAPEYTMTFVDGSNNSSVYTFARGKSGNVAVISEIPTVSGTNDGTNWTSITLGSDTYAIPSGGGSSIEVVNLDTSATPIVITSDQYNTINTNWPNVVIVSQNGNCYLPLVKAGSAAPYTYKFVNTYETESSGLKTVYCGEITVTNIGAPAATYDLKSVSNNYSDLYNKPTIPTKTSDLTNDGKGDVGTRFIGDNDLIGAKVLAGKSDSNDTKYGQISISNYVSVACYDSSTTDHYRTALMTNDAANGITLSHQDADSSDVPTVYNNSLLSMMGECAPLANFCCKKHRNFRRFIPHFYDFCNFCLGVILNLWRNQQWLNRLS